MFPLTLPLKKRAFENESHFLSNALEEHVFNATSRVILTDGYMILSWIKNNKVNDILTEYNCIYQLTSKMDNEEDMEHYQEINSALYTDSLLFNELHFEEELDQAEV